VHVYLNRLLVPTIASILAVNPSMAADPAFVGVTANDLTPERAAALKTGHGAEIAAVTPDSPAAQAGVKEKDVVLSFNGQTVADAKNLTDLILQTTAGASVKLDIVRGDAAMVIPVQTIARPQTPAPIQATSSEPIKDCATTVVRTGGFVVAFTGLACLLDYLFTGGVFCSTLVTTAVVSAPATAAAACAGAIAHR